MSKTTDHVINQQNLSQSDYYQGECYKCTAPVYVPVGTYPDKIRCPRCYDNVARNSSTLTRELVRGAPATMQDPYFSPAIAPHERPLHQQPYTQQAPLPDNRGGAASPHPAQRGPVRAPDVARRGAPSGSKLGEAWGVVREVGDCVKREGLYGRWWMVNLLCMVVGAIVWEVVKVLWL